MRRRKFLKNIALGAASLLISSDKLMANLLQPTGFTFNTAPFRPLRLNYTFKQFEPYLDSKSLESHYHIHRQYAEELNAIIETNPQLQKLTIIEILQNSERFIEGELVANMRNVAGGYYNHCFFWDILTPPQFQHLPLEWEGIIQNQFLDFEQLLEQLIYEAQQLNGSGWVWLLKNDSGLLSVSSTFNEDNPLMRILPIDGFPILGIDMWEHSYFTKFQNSKEIYIKSIWKCIDWQKVFNNYEKPQLV
jgi:Fe-Mn family superoxide dismutase